MKTTFSLAGIVTTLLLSLSASAAYAQEPFWYMPHEQDAKTPIEEKLGSSELAMPGFGIGSTRAQLIKRFEYALEHKWLTSAQVEQFCNELKAITDKEQSQRDADGKLSFQTRSALAKQLNELNGRFEEIVLVREQNSPGVEGLKARQAMLNQRISYGISAGKLSNKRAAQLRAEIAEAVADMPEQDLSDEKSKQIASDLNKINASVEKDLRGPSIANRVTPFSR